MWGFAPADAAVSTANEFQKRGLQEILIPGFGYGRNAKPFIDIGLRVTGIEISKTAIELAKKHYGDHLRVYHGGVGEMPFDRKLYDGIFCYALIHLLDMDERARLVDCCYRQLRPGGYMVFVALSKSTATYGEGVEISKDRFETRHGVKLFFYDADAIEIEFAHHGLVEAEEINEPAKSVENKPSQKFWRIVCRKEEPAVAAPRV